MGERPRPVAPDTLAAGRYELGTVLGSGGMGIVVRAHDHELGRDVAIKLLADNLAMDEDARERFTREARAAARLNHPNVIHIFDVGEEDGRPYIVMELVDGVSLAEREGLREEELVDVARQTLAALDHSHGAGLLHRDIKPANLLLATDGTLKVTDFGVAEVAEAPGLTRTGHVLGTLPYLAPERLRGERASVASDLYALGASLHELVTGDPPKAGTPLPNDVPAGLRQLIVSCLATDPEDRPPSASAAQRLLEGREATRPIAADETVAIVPETEPVEAARDQRSDRVARGDFDVGEQARSVLAWVRRQPPTRLVLASIALLVLIALIAISGDGNGGTGESDPAETDAPEEQAEQVEPIDRADDPATTARNIADWIRDHAED